MTLEKLAITVPEAASLVQVGRSTGYALVANGEWPSIRIGGSVRVPVEALRAWVQRRIQAAEPVDGMTSEEDLKVAASGAAD
jgi:excisionase family DNA binding protein